MTRRRTPYETEAEAAQPSRVDDLRIDSGQAWRIGRFVALLAALIAGGILTSRDIEWWLVPVKAAYIGLIAGAVVCVVLFALFVRDERQDRRQARQPQTARLEVDATPPEPERRMARLRLDIQSGGQHRLLDVDITPELQVFARRVLLWREDALAPLGLSFAETPAANVGFDGFLALRDEMMSRGLLRWKNADNHKSGYTFRAGFDEAMAYIAGYEMEG